MTTIRTNINDITVFTAVVAAGGFSAAARDLDVPTSTVSRRVARLEDRLGVRLLHRTTRKLSLTDGGRLFYERCARIVDDIAEAENVVSNLVAEPRGLIRLTIPGDHSDHIFALIASFLREFPKVSVEVIQTEKTLDLTDEGIDVALRGGGRPDVQSVIARKLASETLLLAASPVYLQRRGRPKSVRGLADHDFVIYSRSVQHSTITLRDGNKSVQVPVAGRFKCNSMAMVKEALLAGFGIGPVLATQAHEELRDGRLVEVLPGALPHPGAFWIVYPSRRHLPSAVRAFVDFTVAHFVDHPWNTCGL